MVIQYKDKSYDSAEIPFFIFFKTPENRREFVNFINDYNQLNTFVRLECVHGILAGSTAIKDKRSKILICIESKEEKQFLQKNLFANQAADSNALLLSPEDIEQRVLEQWVEKNLEHIY